MELLEGAAAFAVIMIVLATAVTGIVEILLRALGMRARVLARLVHRLVVEELLCQSPETCPGDDDALRGMTDRIVSQLVCNPVSRIDGTSQWARLRRTVSEKIGSGHRIDELSTYAMLQRLARTEIGAALMSRGEEELRPALTNIARTFDRYAAASSEVFRKRANMVAFLVAIPFAFLVNVDAARLFHYLLGNPIARAELIERGEAFAEENRAAVLRLEALIERLGTDPAAGTPDAERLLADLRETAGRVNASLREVSNLDLPIGPAYFPWTETGMFYWRPRKDEAGSGDAPAPAVAANGAVPPRATEAGDERLAWGLWVFNTLLGGILIGLGGPFWYKVFQGFSQVIQLMRVLRPSRESAAPAGTEPGEPQPARTTREIAAPAPDEDIVTTFRIAASGSTTRLVDDPLRPPAG